MSKNVLIYVLALGLGVSALYAQSLADLAKKERERQEKAKANPKTGAKVLTERDLKTTGGRTTPSRRATADSAAAPAGRQGSAQRPETDGPKDLNGHDEAYWRQRKLTLQQELERTEQRLKSVDDFLSRHHADYTLQSLATRKSERDALAKQSEEIRQKMQDLEEEARKAGAPPSWLR